MNEVAQELLKRADVIGAWLSGAVTKTADFATTQAIDIAMQYVAFGRAWYTFAVVASLLGILFAAWCAKELVGYIKREDDTGFIHLFAGSIIGLTSLISFFNTAKECIMVWAAPKVWLMIQLAELAKQVKQ